MVNNVTSNIFIEKITENFSDFDEVSYHQNIQRILKYLLNNSDILENCCLKNFEYNTISFDIVLSDNEYIHRVNKDYRKIDRPTDVITFAVFADSPDNEKFVFDSEINLGEIIISLEKIEQQAPENNNSFIDELTVITTHGILHLLGFDHQTENDYNYVVNIQNNVLYYINKV